MKYRTITAIVIRAAMSLPFATYAADLAFLLLGYFYPANRVGSVFPIPQLPDQLAPMLSQAGQKFIHLHPVHAFGSVASLNLLIGGVQVVASKNSVDFATSSTLHSLSGQLLQASVLPTTSFRPHLTMTPLLSAASFPLPGGSGTFTP